MQVLYSPQAEQDIDEIWGYIAQDNPEKATEFIHLIKKTCLFLSEMPEAGTKRDYIKIGLRHFPIKKRSIYYRIKIQHIEIIRILHESRDYKELF